MALTEEHIKAAVFEQTYLLTLHADDERIGPARQGVFPLGGQAPPQAEVSPVRVDEAGGDAAAPPPRSVGVLPASVLQSPR